MNNKQVVQEKSHNKAISLDKLNHALSTDE